MDLLPKDYKSSAQKPRGFEVGELISEELSKKWVVIVLILFIISLFIAVGLKIYQRTLVIKNNKIEQKIQSLEEQQDQVLVNKIISLDQKLIIFKQLLASHIYPSNIIDAVEKSTLPKVQWTNLNLDIKNNTLNLDGNAIDWLTVAKQIAAFEGQSLDVVDISQLAIGKGGWVNFGLKIKIPNK